MEQSVPERIGADLLMFGFDTGLVTRWHGPDAETLLLNSDCPVMGIGEGGYSYFGQLDLRIGCPRGWHGKCSVALADPSAEPLLRPREVTLDPEGRIRMYGEASHAAEIHLQF